MTTRFTVRGVSDGTMATMAGRYQSWFLSARDADDGRRPRALWIPPHPPPGGGRRARVGRALVHAVRPGRAAGGQAVDGEFLADADAGPRGFRGEARARGRMAAWELTLSGEEAPLRHLRPGALYRFPLPRTKLEAPLPDGIASGRVVLDGRVLEVVGWRATAGHNWGAEHAERWVWLHAAGFEDEPEAWLELTLARVRVGGRTTPWVANGAVSIGRERFQLGGLGRVPGVRVVAAPGRLEAIVPGDRARIRVAVHADLAETAGFPTRASAPTRSPASARCSTPGSPRLPPQRPPPRPPHAGAGDRGRRRVRARRARVHQRGRAPALSGPLGVRRCMVGPTDGVSPWMTRAARDK